MKSEDSTVALARVSYGLTIFVGAFLMFQIQPLVGKVVTAQFGGVAAIWCVCLMFFQTALLTGYLLTFLITKLPMKQQTIVYCLLMAASVAFLNVPPASAWSAAAGLHPVENLLVLLTVHLAAPCTLLSTISGLMQSWYTAQKLGDPYPLYGLSNIGSMAALLLYPVTVEPLLGVNKALTVWNGGYVLLASLAILSALVMFKRGAQEDAAETSCADRKPTFRDGAWWVGLSSLASVILIVYTTYITQDIAPVPFLWILPLCVYLLAFIICFGKNNAYHRSFFLYIGPIFWVLDVFARRFQLLNVLCILAMIFSFTMVCCGEMMRRKPSPKYLSAFYLAIAFGGVVGSVLVNLLMPISSDFYAERFVIIFVMFGLLLHACLKDDLQLMPDKVSNHIYLWILGYTVLLLDGYLVYALCSNVVARYRNFYGCISVVKQDGDLVLANGTIVHGSQSLESTMRREPTRYFSRDTAVGYVDTLMRRRLPWSPVRYGVVGLGAGTIAAYGQPGDFIRFFEIDPKVELVARKYFTYLSDSRAKVEVQIGDGRKALEQEHHEESYDVLVIDAFNGDAVPIHLLTKEAIALYMQHVKPEGVCLLHVSNRYLNLPPAISNIAHSLGFVATSLDNDHSRYVAVTRAVLPTLTDTGILFNRLVRKPTPQDPAIGVWTDDYSNLFSALVSNLKY